MITAKNGRVYASELHHEYMDWQNELHFFAEEMKILQKRLAEVAASNTSHEVMAQVEQYQNRLIRQKEVHDELLHEIRTSDQKLEQDISANPVASDHKTWDDPVELREKMIRFRELYKEFKEGLLKFAGQWL